MRPSSSVHGSTEILPYKHPATNFKQLVGDGYQSNMPGSRAMDSRCKMSVGRPALTEVPLPATKRALHSAVCTQEPRMLPHAAHKVHLHDAHHKAHCIHNLQAASVHPRHTHDQRAPLIHLASPPHVLQTARHLIMVSCPHLAVVDKHLLHILQAAGRGAPCLQRCCPPLVAACMAPHELVITQRAVRRAGGIAPAARGEGVPVAGACQVGTGAVAPEDGPHRLPPSRDCQQAHAGVNRTDQVILLILTLYQSVPAP